jgi:hypothetical protein
VLSDKKMTSMPKSSDSVAETCAPAPSKLPNEPGDEDSGRSVDI